MTSQRGVHWNRLYRSIMAPRALCVKLSTMSVRGDDRRANVTNVFRVARNSRPVIPAFSQAWRQSW
jgi:hypothetical protein